MNILVYKRTHKGDPNDKGIFGCDKCMRSVRSRRFDAVIGVGGKSRSPMKAGIARKLTWIGRNARKDELAKDGFPTVVFERFVLWDEKGPDLKKKAPRLYKYMFKKGHDVRYVMSDSRCRKIQKEIEKLLAFFKRPENFPSPKVLLEEGQRSPVGSQRTQKPPQKHVDLCRRNQTSAHNRENKKVCKSSC